jgi:SAM-dependent methyltransferase
LKTIAQIYMTTEDYRDSHSAKGYGIGYQDAFDSHPYRKYTWGTEKAILDSIIEGNREVLRYLDFACGTGRVLRHLEQKVGNATGVDVSEAMLTVARKQSVRASIVCADITKDNPFADSTFDLITSFRFFLNAQPDLRRAVAKQLASLMTEDGHLVFNNHNNTTSIANVIAVGVHLLKHRKRPRWNQMSTGEVKRLLSEFDLEVVKVYNYATFPVYDEAKPFHGSLVRTIDRFFSNVLKIPFLSRYLIYVCRKRKSIERKA